MHSLSALGTPQSRAQWQTPPAFICTFNIHDIVQLPFHLARHFHLIPYLEGLEEGKGKAGRKGLLCKAHEHDANIRVNLKKKKKR